LTDPELVGQTLGKRYLVRRVIGQGGMGAVYEVEHTFTKRIGALKLLHKSVAAVPEVVERFVREASAAGRIGNEHIVETIDAGELDSGEPYIFMELLDGKPLSELVQAGKGLPFEEALELVTQAAEGLGAAHEAGIVHRDIKPENLFVCDGATPFVKILDFGISKFARNDARDHRLTREGSAMGTPYYMSPEQVVGGRNVDARTDVYSLGVVLYECVTGQTPFDAESLPALSVRIHEGNYVPASHLRPSAPPGFDVLVARAMAVSPADRFASMQAFRDALLTFERAPVSLSARSATPSSVPAGRAAPSTSASMFGETSPSGLPNAGEPPEAKSPADVERALPELIPRRRRTPLLIATAVAAVVAWALARTLNHEHPEPEPPVPSTVTPVAAKPVISSLPEPRAAPLRGLPGVVVTPSASNPAGAVPSTQPAASAIPKKATATQKPAPVSSSRAKKDGLTEKNPFDEP
jgi:serine/threonine protein kinase